MNKAENEICRINFYHKETRLVKVGTSDDSYINAYGGRIEVFEIFEDEQLIGCKLDQDRFDCFDGVIWIKMKVLGL